MAALSTVVRWIANEFAVSVRRQARLLERLAEGMPSGINSTADSSCQQLLTGLLRANGELEVCFGCLEALQVFESNSGRVTSGEGWDR